LGADVLYLCWCAGKPPGSGCSLAQLVYPTCPGSDTSGRVASVLYFIRFLAFQSRAKAKACHGKAALQQGSRLALPDWSALQERLCRGGGQQDEHSPTEERL